MSPFATIPTEGRPNDGVRRLLAGLLEKGMVDAVMVPTRQAHRNVVMPALIADPGQLLAIDPFAPVAWNNAGTLAASLTIKPMGTKFALVLRSCEVRSFVELVKLHQGSAKDVLLIGVDCFGRYENRDYLAASEQDESFVQRFLDGAAERPADPLPDGPKRATACLACEHPVAEAVDLRLCLVGLDPKQELWLEALTSRGREALASLGLPLKEQGPPGRDAAIATLKAERTAFRDALLAGFQEKTRDSEALAELLATCRNCYNCRVACPVCYCRQCVFCTDSFRYDSEKYLSWSLKRGSLKLPSDTLYYHLTRMLHMSTLCVGCGQCSSACPNDIPVMELFRSVAASTQARFSYVPGRSLDEPQPLAIFHDGEFEEVTGSGG